MANYLGTGRLIGYKTYVSNNKAGHTYYVMVEGAKDPKTALFEDVEIIKINEETQVLKELKPQNVSYDLMPEQYGSKTFNKYKNIRAAT